MVDAANIIRCAASHIKLYKSNLKAVFDSVSSSDDGFITPQELERIFVKLGLHLNPFELSVVSRVFEINSEGKLSLDNFLWEFFDRRKFVRRWARNFNSLPHEDAVTRFRLVDVRGSGKLNLQGFRRLLKLFNVELSEESLSLLFKRFAGKPGYLEMMAFLEFCEREQIKIGDRPSKYVEIYQQALVSQLLIHKSALQRRTELLQSPLSEL